MYYEIINLSKDINVMQEVRVASDVNNVTKIINRVDLLVCDSRVRLCVACHVF